MRRKLLLALLIVVLVVGNLFLAVDTNNAVMAENGSLIDSDDESLIAGDELSEIEKSFNRRFSDMTDIDHADLRHFAFGIFESDHDFRSVSEMTVGLDYIIGPGDSLEISVSGSTYFNETVEVNREGKIDLTDIGTVNIWGLSLREAREVITNKVEEYYSGVDVTVTLGELRSISVYVVGEVENPGIKTISSLSTVLHALFEAGGPTSNGSLRELQLIRDNEVIAEMDLYDFILGGKREGNLNLRNDDTVFVKTSQKTYGIGGQVRRPAIYESSEDIRLSELLEMAGGLSPLACTNNILIERIEPGSDVKLTEITIDEDLDDFAGSEGDIVLSDNDLVYIDSIRSARMPDVNQYVTVSGNVRNPGNYSFEDGVTLKDVIERSGGILPETIMDRVEIFRYVSFENRELISLDLEKVMEDDPDHNIELNEWDQINIYADYDILPEKNVTISGEVNEPGTFKLKTGMNLRDLIFAAHEPTDDAYLRNVELYRPNHDNENLPKVISIDLSELDNAKDYDLKPGDRVFVRSHISNEIKEVSIRGEVNLPGDYVIEAGERLQSVIERAGGLTSLAHPYSAKFTRDDVEARQHDQLMNYINYQQRILAEEESRVLEQTIGDEERSRKLASIEQQKEALKYMEANLPEGRVIFDLDNALENNDSAHNLILADGDRLVIPARPQVVIVSGEVYNPESIVFEEDLTVDDYINKVGGIRETGSEDDIYVLRADGSVTTSRQGIDEINEGDIIVVPPAVDRFSEGGTN